MLDKKYQEKFTPRAKAEANKLLQELGITTIDEDNIGEFLDILMLRISGLVTLDEDEHQPIDRELLAIYDLLMDIVVDYDNGEESDYEFFNKLFFD